MAVENTNEQKKQFLPERFGRYIVNDRIGLGGFASVYSALDPELDSTVAVKVLADNHSADAETRRRFLEEARVAREIASDRLINVYDVGQTNDNRPYVVMQLADRGTLGDRLAEVTEPTSRDLRLLISELADSLKAVHDRSIVHRDIKPSNLLLISLKGKQPDTSGSLIRTDERVVLADFGLARDISGGVSGMTIAGGTAGYMAPEQLRPDGQPDRRADLYAASAIIAAIACGVHPERLNLPASDVPERLKSVLITQLSEDPNLRPDSAEAWRDQLLAALDHHEVQETTEINPNDVAAALSNTDAWQPPPQPPQSASSAQQPPANSWDAQPNNSGGSHSGSTLSQPAANYGTYQPQATSNSYQQGYNQPNYSYGSTTGYTHQPEPSAAVTFTRGLIGLVVSFILLFLLAVLVIIIEGDSVDGPAARLALIISIFGPMVCFFVAMRYLPWPRAKG